MSVEIHIQTCNELNKRRYERIRMAVPVTVAGQLGRAEDWSVGGFRLAGPAPAAIDGLYPVTITIPAHRLRIVFQMKARLAHQDEQGRFAGFEFIDKTLGQTDMLRALVIFSVSGGAFPLTELVNMAENRQALAAARRSGRHDDPLLGYSIRTSPTL